MTRAIFAMACLALTATGAAAQQRINTSSMGCLVMVTHFKTPNVLKDDVAIYLNGVWQGFTHDATDAEERDIKASYTYLCLSDADRPIEYVLDQVGQN